MMGIRQSAIGNVQSAIGGLQQRPLRIVGIGVALIAVFAGVRYWVYPYYTARRDLAEARQLLDNLEMTAAKDRLEKYLQQRPNDGEAHLLMARADRLIGLTPTAMAHLRQAEDLSGPPAEIILEKLLLTAQQSGDLSSQTAVLQNYLDSHSPEAPLILNALVLGAHRARRLDLTNRWLEKWVTDYPDDWRGHFLSGTFFRNRGVWSRAEAAFERALALHPGFPETHHWLGVTLVRAGHGYPEAVNHLETYLKTSPNSQTALTALAQAQLALNDRDVAATTVQRLLNQDSKHVWGLLMLAQIRLEEGLFNEAIEALDKVSIFETDDPRERAMLLYLQARSHRLLGNTAKAEAFEKQHAVIQEDMQRLILALEKSSAPGGNTDMQRNVGLLYMRLGSYSEAAQWLSAVLRANPDDKIAHQALAECYSHRGDPESRERAEYHRQRSEK